MRSARTALAWYRRSLKLYPKAYRDEYEDEVINTFAAMLESARTRAERRQLFVLVVKDYISALSRYNLYSTTTSFTVAPQPVKRDTMIGAALVAPFFVVFFYNISSLAINHVIVPDIQQLEAHTWIIYSIIMPLIALTLITVTCLKRVYAPLRRHHWRQALQVIFKDWLFAGVLIGFCALVAIF